MTAIPTSGEDLAALPVRTVVENLLTWAAEGVDRGVLADTLMSRVAAEVDVLARIAEDAVDALQNAELHLHADDDAEREVIQGMGQARRAITTRVLAARAAVRPGV